MRLFAGIFLFLPILFFLFSLPQKVFAVESGFFPATTCATNGSSCSNMTIQDSNYNSWIGITYEEIIATFTGFGIPNDSVIDDIQMKMRIKTSTSGWTWFVRASVDGVNYFSPVNCSTFGDVCRYNTTVIFNSITSPTITWLNNNPNHIITGADINSQGFRIKLFQSTGIKNTDIDVLLFNIRYHLSGPTPTPTPTPVVPEPFLDLPWDYEGQGQSFSDAALAINSYFDHEYPLLSSGLTEPAVSLDIIVSSDGITYTKEQRSYSSHDGYDWAKVAKVNIGDPVLAAAAGTATYINSCTPCGNMILIDHGNGYQTRYLHMQKDGLITDVPNNPIQVDAGQPIGKVGATGNIKPAGDAGAHIHFGVFQDKNNDGNFDDNIPDGVTDPFGWQSEDPDPWENYSFFYGGIQRTGNKSYYLWNKSLGGTSSNLTSAGGSFSAGRYSVDFPSDAVSQNTTIELTPQPIISPTEFLSSVGTTLLATARDQFGDIITDFLEPLTLTIDFSNIDLSRYDLSTLSIYSSQDGEVWSQELTDINFINNTATTTIVHFTHFALMAERLDTLVPTTTAILSGEQGLANWFKSDVAVSLSAQDNAGGLGVDYTMFRLNDEDWQQYLIPLLFSNEGHYKVEFYSADNDENIEAVNNVEFDIDKTPPLASISAGHSVIWPPNGKLVPVKIKGAIEELHLFSKSFTVDDEYGKIFSTISEFGEEIILEAKRNGNDFNGREYKIIVHVEDLAGNKSNAEAQVIVPHDQGN